MFHRRPDVRIFFRGYTFGSGEPIVKGGRYDRLLKHFGKDAPAIGFVIVTDQLLAALSRQKIDVPVERRCQLVIYDAAHREDAVVYARRQRAAGCSVELLLRDAAKTEADYKTYASRSQITRITFLDGRTEPWKETDI